MALKTCECCGQVLPDQWELVAARARLSRKQTELFLAVASGNGAVVRYEVLENAMYGLDPEGGPLNMRNTIAVTAYNANRSLEKLGYHIKSGGMGTHGQGMRLITPSSPQ